VKDSFYEELERVFDMFPRYMTILLGYFDAKVGREDFLNRQLEMKVYTKLAMVMELDRQYISYSYTSRKPMIQ
jgi:hypothetical protein